MHDGFRRRKSQAGGRRLARGMLRFQLKWPLARRLGCNVRLVGRTAPSPMQQRRMSTAGGGSSSSDRGGASWWSDNANVGAAMLAVAVGTAGLSYASVPLYRMFCQATGFGGTVKTHKGGDEAEGYDLPADPSTLRNNRLLTISFNTDVDTSLPWSFKPVQRQVRAGASVARADTG